jgi:soluble lytic murein transglycosylase-like protein
MSRMPALLAAGLALSVATASCGGRADALRESEGSPGATSSPATPTSPEADCPCPHPSSPLPQPDAWIPRAPDRLARAIDATTRSLRAAIDRWTTESDGSSERAPLDVRLLALYQQRIYRMLARDPTLAGLVVARLSTSVAREARINVAAGADLLSLAGPVSRPDLIRTQPPEPPEALLGFYREAEDRFGVAWQVLAAVNYTESKFGRVVSASSAGAQGPMQFIPSTWAAYGLGGDVHDPHDAVLGAANYLHASGAPANYRVALYHYNPVPEYVDAVMRYARQMTRDPRTFYAYYNWQVFVLTKHGDLRLTGPGL